MTNPSEAEAIDMNYFRGKTNAALWLCTDSGLTFFAEIWPEVVRKPHLSYDDYCDATFPRHPTNPWQWLFIP